MINEIILDGRKIQFDFIRKNVKNINIRIKPDQSVYVSASEDTPFEYVEETLHEKAEYILSSLDKYAEIAKYAPQPKQYIDGETFRLLGHDYRLKVQDDNHSSVTIEGIYIILKTKNPSDKKQKERIMNKWLKKQCEETIFAVCEAVYPKFRKYGIEFPVLRFRNMVSRWGSCHAKKGILTFNISLIEAPLMCIEYVVTHEFVHFLQPNHSRKFYQQLAMFMPDWQERKKILEYNNLYKE